jgi:hypothetical protein
MRQLGYEIEPKYSKLAINKTDIMAKSQTNYKRASNERKIKLRRHWLKN